MGQLVSHLTVRRLQEFRHARRVLLGIFYFTFFRASAGRCGELFAAARESDHLPRERERPAEINLRHHHPSSGNPPRTLHKFYNRILNGTSIKSHMKGFMCAHIQGLTARSLFAHILHDMMRFVINLVTTCMKSERASVGGWHKSKVERRLKSQTGECMQHISTDFLEFTFLALSMRRDRCDCVHSQSLARSLSPRRSVISGQTACI
jgi:hypothetical protein